MEQVQINQLEMYDATNSYLDVHAAIWSPIPVISNYKTTLLSVIQSIKKSAQDQDSAQIFIGSTLRQLKEQIAIKMDILDDTLEAYADDTENMELLHQASNSKSDYFQLSHEDFETKTKNMIALIEENATAMADYGMSTEQIDEVKASFDHFQDKRGTPRSYQIASRVATTDLEELFKEGNKVLARLDKVMKRYKRSNSSLYNGYLAARKVIKN